MHTTAQLQCHHHCDIILQTISTEFCNTGPSTTKKRKRKRVRKGTKTPPNHESRRASKLSKPSLLSLFSPFLRSSREEKNLTNFSSFSALHSIALVAFSPSPLPKQTQCCVWYPSAKQKTATTTTQTHKFFHRSPVSSLAKLKENCASSEILTNTRMDS